MKIIKARAIERTKNWRVLLYGKPGLGKTSVIKSLTGKTLVLDMDHSSKVLGGTDNIDVIEFDRNHPTEFMKMFLTEIDSLLSEYDNLVIDNLTSFQSDWFVEAF